MLKIMLISSKLIGWRMAGENLYTSINSMSMNNYFSSAAPKIYNNVVGDKVGIIRNELPLLWILSTCKLRRITPKLNIKPFELYSAFE